MSDSLSIILRIAVVILVIVSISKFLKEYIKLKKKTVTLGAKEAIIVSHIEGLQIEKNAYCELYLFDEKILIDTTSIKFEIQLKNIRKAVVKSQRDLRKEGKGIIGEPIIGTLLIPGLGDIVRSKSIVGYKLKISEHHNFLIVNYINSNRTQSGITLLINSTKFKAQGFCDSINQTISRAKNDNVIKL